MCSRSAAPISSQNIEGLQAGVQSLAWSDWASRARWIGTKLDHKVFHRIDEIQFRDISGSIRIERTPYRISALRFKNRWGIERLKRLIELGLIDRAGTARVDRIEQTRHLLVRRHVSARTRNNSQIGGGPNCSNRHRHRFLRNLPRLRCANYKDGS